jgi:hypothetical protein
VGAGYGTVSQERGLGLAKCHVTFFPTYFKPYFFISVTDSEAFIGIWLNIFFNSNKFLAMEMGQKFLLHKTQKNQIKQCWESYRKQINKKKQRRK